MHYRVEFTFQAEVEADSAYEWIVKESPTNAQSWFEGLLESIESLSSLPERCPIALESEDVGQEIRNLLYGKFRILFLIEDQTVFILHVRHGAQQHLTKEKF